MDTVQISRQMAEELDALRLSIYDEHPEIETQLAHWMTKAGFRHAFKMEWLPDSEDEEVAKVEAADMPNHVLIAAAPKLLAACQAIISCAGEGSSSLETARKLARAAIAKAEGR